VRSLFLASLVLVAGPGLRAEDAFRVEFLRPSHGDVVLGEAEIELALQLPPGGVVARIDLTADGQVFASLTAPPWSAPWNAGEGATSRELGARVVLTDGRETRTAIRTSKLRIDQIERVDLVDLYITVRDRTGSYVTDLEAEDFQVLENGVPQKVERFSSTHQPLRLAIVLDTSVSMSKSDRLDRARSAAVDFLDVLQPSDECLIVGFSDEVRVLQELSSDRQALAAAIHAVEPLGGTALYDAIWRTADRLRDFPGRRVLVLLSDGRDEAANGLEPGSLHTLEEAIDRALKTNVIVFTIGIGNNLDREYAMLWGPLHGRSNHDTSRSLEGILRQLAETTGGRAVITSSTGKIRRAFEQFANDLRHQYSIAYTSSDVRRDGKWRKLKVETPGRELTVVTRKGYFAPGGG